MDEQHCPAPHEIDLVGTSPHTVTIDERSGLVVRVSREPSDRGTARRAFERLVVEKDATKR